MQLIAINRLTALFKIQNYNIIIMNYKQIHFSSSVFRQHTWQCFEAVRVQNGGNRGIQIQMSGMFVSSRSTEAVFVVGFTWGVSCALLYPGCHEIGDEAGSEGGQTEGDQTGAAQFRETQGSSSLRVKQFLSNVQWLVVIDLMCDRRTLKTIPETCSCCDTTKTFIPPSSNLTWKTCPITWVTVHRLFIDLYIWFRDV